MRIELAARTRDGSDAGPMGVPIFGWGRASGASTGFEENDQDLMAGFWADAGLGGGPWLRSAFRLQAGLPRIRVKTGELPDVCVCPDLPVPTRRVSMWFTNPFDGSRKRSFPVSGKPVAGGTPAQLLLDVIRTSSSAASAW